MSQVGPPPATIPSVAVPILGTLGSPGQARATFEYHPGFTLFTTYTDNFFRTEHNRESNLRTGIISDHLLYINGAFTKGSIATSLNFNHDTVAGAEGNFFPSLVGRIEWQATPRLVLSASDSLSRSDDPSRADRLSLRNTRVTFASNVFEADAYYSLDAYSARAYYRLSTFQDDGGDDTLSHTVGVSGSTRLGASSTGTLGYEYIDSTTDGTTGKSVTRGHSITASLSRQLNPFTSAGVSGGYSYRTQKEPGINDHFQTLNVSLFNNYVLPGRFVAAANVGYSRIIADDGRTADSFTTSTSLTYLFARAVASIVLDKGFSETFALGQDFGVVETQGVTLTLTYPFTPLIFGSGSVYYRDNKDTQIGGGRSDFNTDSYGGQVSVSYRLLSWLTLLLEYAYSHEKTADRSKVIENRGRASLTAGF